MKRNIELISKRILRGYNAAGIGENRTKADRQRAQREYLQKHCQMVFVVKEYEKNGFNCPFPILFLMSVWFEMPQGHNANSSRTIREILKAKYINCGAKWNDSNSNDWARATALVNTKGEIFAHRYTWSLHTNGMTTTTKIVPAPREGIVVSKQLDALIDKSGVVSSLADYFEPCATSSDLYLYNQVKRREEKKREYPSSAQHKFDLEKKECIDAGIKEDYLNEIMVIRKQRGFIELLRMLRERFMQNSIGYTMELMMEVIRAYPNLENQAMMNFIDLIVWRPNAEKIRSILSKEVGFACLLARHNLPRIQFSRSNESVYSALVEYSKFLKREKARIRDEKIQYRHGLYGVRTTIIAETPFNEVLLDLKKKLDDN